MRPSKIDDHELLDRLADVFRVYGFEGASLSRIAKATGLQRASLYHRFPDGKEEMARAVMAHVDGWFADNVLTPLGNGAASADRVRRMADRLDELYAGGGRSCLLDTLSLGDGNSPLRRHIVQTLTAWQDALAGVARDSGLAPAAARQRAEQALIGIEGALVLARATGDRGPFQRVLRRLPELLTNADTPLG